MVNLDPGSFKIPDNSFSTLFNLPPIEEIFTGFDNKNVGGTGSGDVTPIDTNVPIADQFGLPSVDSFFGSIANTVTNAISTSIDTIINAANNIVGPEISQIIQDILSPKA